MQLVEDIALARDNFFKSKKQYEKYYEISEGTIGILITESIDIQTKFCNALDLQESLIEVSDNIRDTEQDIDKDKKVIADSQNEIARLQKLLSDNFELCEACGKPV